MLYFMLADRWFLAAIFLVAGVAKAGHTEEFTEAVDRYGIVPRPLVAPLAIVLPFVELGLGLALAAGVWPVVAGCIAAVVFAGFGGAISWNLAHGRRFDCGCGVGGDAPLGWSLVLRNIALTILAAAIAVGPSTALALFPGAAAPAHSPAGAALIPIPLMVILGCLVGRLAMDFRPVNWFHRRASARARGGQRRPYRSLGR